MDTIPSLYQKRFVIYGLPRVVNFSFGDRFANLNEISSWKRKVKRAVFGETPSRSLIRAQVTLTRCSTREPDYDNLTQAFRYVLNALVENHVIFDDSPVYVDVKYRWRYARPTQGKIIIDVKELEADKELILAVKKIERRQLANLLRKIRKEKKAQVG